MSTLQAAQLIYTRVEPGYSHENRSGYQTVYKSQGLTPQDVSAVEQRIQCYRPNEPSAVRYQFFSIPNGAVALVQSKGIPTDAVIIDKDGRSGVFLAHCLVLSPDDFRRLDFLPFPIFDRFPFIGSAQEMVREFGQATGLAPNARLEVEAARARPATTWRSSETRKLLGLAVQAKQLAAGGRSLYMVGSQSDIGEALRVTFSLLPRELRPLCSFDTCVDSCMTPPGLYWAVGGSFRDSNSLYIEVDAKNRRVAATVTTSLEPNDLYFTWLDRALTLNDTPQVVERAGAVQDIASSFAEGRKLGKTEVDDQAIGDFLDVHEGLVRRAFQDALRKAVGERLAAQWQDDLWNIWPCKVCLAAASSQHIPLEALRAFAADWLQARHPDLPESEWKRLQDLGREGGDSLLLFLSSVLGNKPNDPVRQEALLNMDAATFRQAAELMPKTIPPAYYVTQNHLPQLLKSPQLSDMSADQLVDLINAIVTAGFGFQLSPLNSFVGGLDSDSLSRVEKLIRKNPQIPHDFASTVERRRQQVGEPAGLFGRIKSRLPGGSSDR